MSRREINDAGDTLYDRSDGKNAKIFGKNDFKTFFFENCTMM